MAFETLREGRAVATGEFLLDEERARQKLQNFQLANPHYYVLEFVKFAHLMGAEDIDFTVEAGQLEMRFGGDLLSASELAELHAAAFMRREDLRLRARRHLAIGVNVAGALGLRELIIEVGGDDPAAVQVTDDAVERCEPMTAGLKGTRIFLRRRVSPAVFFRSFSALFDDLPEAQALADRAKFSATPIYVNDALVSRGMRNDTTAPEFRYEHEGEVGFVTATLSETDQEATVLQHGVWISTDRRGSPFLPFGVRAIVDSPLLTPNLSQSAFVQDEAWQALHERVTKAALQAVIEKLRRVSDDVLKLQTQQFRQLIQSIISSDLFGNLNAESAEEVCSLLGSLPVFEDIFARPTTIDDQLSIADAIVEVGEIRIIHFSTNRFLASIGNPVDGPILLVPSTDVHYPGVEASRSKIFREFLEKFADQAIDLTDDLDRRATRRSNKKSWESGHWSFNKNELVDIRESKWGGLLIRVGLFDPRQPAPVPRGSGVYFILEEKILAYCGVGVRGLGFFIEIAGDLQPDELFERPIPTWRLNQTQEEAVKILVEMLDGMSLQRAQLGDLRRQLQDAFQWQEWPKNLGGLPDPDEPTDHLDAIVKRIMAERRARRDGVDESAEAVTPPNTEHLDERAKSLLERLDQLDRGEEPIIEGPSIEGPNIEEQEDVAVEDEPKQLLKEKSEPHDESHDETKPEGETRRRSAPSARTRQGRAIFELFADYAPPHLTPRIFKVENLYVTDGGGRSPMICTDRDTPILDGEHPTIAQALAHPDDQIAQKMAALAIYAALDDGTDARAVLRRRSFIDALMLASA